MEVPEKAMGGKPSVEDVDDGLSVGRGLSCRT